MIELLTALFTVEQFNAELAAQGLPEMPVRHLAARVIISKRQCNNLDDWTALYLDLNGGKYSKDDLQNVLVAGGASSDKAWSSRLSRQRKPDFYHVKPAGRARSVPASIRTGRVVVSPLADLSDDDQAALAAYYQAVEDAKPKAGKHAKDEAAK